MLILSFVPVACLHCNKATGWGDDNLLLYIKMQSYFNLFFYMKWNRYYLTCDLLKQIQSRNYSKSTAWRRLISSTMSSNTARAPFVKDTSKQIFEESIPLIIHFKQEIIWKANETQIITVKLGLFEQNKPKLFIAIH